MVTPASDKHSKQDSETTEKAYQDEPFEREEWGKWAAHRGRRSRNEVCAFVSSRPGEISLEIVSTYSERQLIEELQGRWLVWSESR